MEKINFYIKILSIRGSKMKIWIKKRNESTRVNLESVGLRFEEEKLLGNSLEMENNLKLLIGDVHFRMNCWFLKVYAVFYGI